MPTSGHAYNVASIENYATVKLTQEEFRVLTTIQTFAEHKLRTEHPQHKLDCVVEAVAAFGNMMDAAMVDWAKLEPLGDQIRKHLSSTP